jgi:hypothetical protein
MRSDYFERLTAYETRHEEYRRLDEALTVRRDSAVTGSRVRAAVGRFLVLLNTRYYSRRHAM